MLIADMGIDEMYSLYVTHIKHWNKLEITPRISEITWIEFYEL